MYKSPDPMTTAGLRKTGKSESPRHVENKDQRTITICHPVWRLGRGGLERQLVQSVNRLPGDQFRHIVAVCGWDESSETLATQIGSHVELIRQPLDANMHTWSRRLATTLTDRAVDLVHVRGLSLLLDSLMAVELHGECRIACSFHGFQSAGGDFHGVRKKVYREALLRCHDRWAVSQAAAKGITRELNLPRDSFGVVRNGVDTTRFVPAADKHTLRAKLQLPQDRIIALCLGNLKPIKGQAVLLEALGRIGHAAEQATIVFIGEDGMDGRLQRWAKHNLEFVDVRFIREQDDPLPWYQAADIFVQPSLSEGLSNALLEAMACELAVIATNVGGNADVVFDGRTGCLVPENDAASLAFALAQLVTRPTIRGVLARAARARMIEEFGVETMIDDLAKKYTAIMTEPECELTKGLLDRRTDLRHDAINDPRMIASIHV